MLKNGLNEVKAFVQGTSSSTPDWSPPSLVLLALLLRFMFGLSAWTAGIIFVFISILVFLLVTQMLDANEAGLENEFRRNRKIAHFALAVFWPLGLSVLCGMLIACCFDPDCNLFD